MIVVVDGLNKSGRTTFANMLSVYGFKYIDPKLEYSDGGKEDQMYLNTGKMCGIITMLYHIDDDVVIDGFHLHEWVYGSLVHGYANSSVFSIDDELSILDARLVLMESNYIDESNSYLNNLMKYTFSLSKIKKMPYNLDCPVGEVLSWLGLRREDEEKPAVVNTD